MGEPEGPDGVISKSELMAALHEARAAITEHQLERWRGWGLLPAVKQVGLGRPGGSESYYPETTVEQAIEADRLFRRNRKKEFVGFELWWRGFEVDEQYWRPMLTSQSNAIAKAIRKVARLVRAAESDEKLADEVYSEVPKSIAPQAIAGAVRNIPQADFSDAFHQLFKALAGGESLEDEWRDPSEHDGRPKTTISLLGFSQSKSDAILDQRLRPDISLRSVFAAISSAKNIPDIDDTFFSGDKRLLLFRARDDVRIAFEIARNLHEALAWIYGPRAFGLKAARWFHDHAPAAAKAAIALAWMAARENAPEEFLSSEAIEDLREKSADAATNSARLKTIIERDPMLSSICSPKRLKLSMSSGLGFEDLCAEIRNIRAQQISQAQRQ